MSNSSMSLARARAAPPACACHLHGSNAYSKEQQQQQHTAQSCVSCSTIRYVCFLVSRLVVTMYHFDGKDVYVGSPKNRVSLQLGSALPTALDDQRHQPYVNCTLTHCCFILLQCFPFMPAPCGSYRAFPHIANHERPQASPRHGRCRHSSTCNRYRPDGAHLQHGTIVGEIYDVQASR
jgi:hypothetical protein